MPFLGLEDEYVIPNCDCARAEQQEMGSIVMDATVVDDTIVTDVTDPNCKLCKQDPAPNCHAHPNVYILFVPFFQPLHEDSPTQKNQRWFYKNAMLWMAADCCQNYYVEEDPDDDPDDDEDLRSPSCDGSDDSHDSHDSHISSLH